MYKAYIYTQGEMTLRSAVPIERPPVVRSQKEAVMSWFGFFFLLLLLLVFFLLSFSLSPSCPRVRVWENTETFQQPFKHTQSNRESPLALYRLVLYIYRRFAAEAAAVPRLPK